MEVLGQENGLPYFSESDGVLFHMSSMGLAQDARHRFLAHRQAQPADFQ